MFRILVADDEDFIRRGIIAILKRNLPSETEPCFLEASDGYEAFRQTDTMPVELVITDIRMPGASGLDFIKKLRTIHPDTPVIVISGYEDFKYAQKAISLGVCSYITKPVNKQELIDLVLHIIGESQKAIRRQTESVQKNIANKEIEKELKESLFLQYFTCTECEQISTLTRKLQKMGISFHGTLFVCVCVQYNLTHPMEFLDFAIVNIFQESLASIEEFHYLGDAKTSENTLTFLISGDETSRFLSKLKQTLLIICQRLIDYYHCAIFMGVGHPIYDTLSIYRSYQTALEAANFKLFHKEYLVQLYSETHKGDALFPKQIDELTKAIRNLDKLQIAHAFHTFFTPPCTRQKLSILTEAYERFVKTFTNYLAPYEPLSKEIRTPAPLSTFFGMSMLHQEIFSCLDAYEQMKATRDAGPSNQRLLADIKLYVHEHLADALDLTAVAELFDKSPSYISLLFKKGMQKGFNEYVTEERVRLAKEYLKDCSIPINEVSLHCGYVNAKYFSVVFKKVTGETPRDYRFRCERGRG